MGLPSKVLPPLFLAGLLGACATSSERMRDNDPFEETNRAIFAFNQGVDKYAALPLAKAYRATVPEPARNGIHNVLDNLGEPVTFANDLLQGDVHESGNTLGRFAVNSTVGLAGLFDVASGLGLPKHHEDFGATLGDYGVGEGPYLVLPLLGPAPPRDLVGRVGDFFLDPVTALGAGVAIGRDSASTLDDRERNIETVDAINEMSIDTYARVRSVYRQHRDMEIRGSAKTTEDLPDF